MNLSLSLSLLQIKYSFYPLQLNEEQLEGERIKKKDPKFRPLPLYACNVCHRLLSFLCVLRLTGYEIKSAHKQQNHILLHLSSTYRPWWKAGEWTY